MDAALLDSINLSGAMDALFDLVRSANRYMDEREASAEADKGMRTKQCCHIPQALACEASSVDIVEQVHGVHSFIRVLVMTDSHRMGIVASFC